MVMMRWFRSVVVVSLLLLYVALFSLSSHNVHLHGGLVLDELTMLMTNLRRMGVKTELRPKTKRNADTMIGASVSTIRSADFCIQKASVKSI